MNVEKYIDKSKLISIACASIGIAALIFVQKVTTPVKSVTDNHNGKSTSRNKNSNISNKVNHSLRAQSKRLRRSVHTSPNNQGITSLTNNINNSSSKTDHNNSSSHYTTPNSFVKSISLDRRNLEHEQHEHKHQHHNNNTNSNLRHRRIQDETNNSNTQSSIIVHNENNPQRESSINNSAHNISEVQPSQAVNRSSGATSFMTRSSVRNHSLSYAANERSISPVINNTKLENKDNNIAEHDNMTKKKNEQIINSEPTVKITEKIISTTKVKADQMNNKCDTATNVSSSSSNNNINNKTNNLNYSSHQGKKNNNIKDKVITSTTEKSISPSALQSINVLTNESRERSALHTNDRSRNNSERQTQKDDAITSENLIVNGQVNNTTVITKPLTVESLHHLRQQTENVSPSKSTLTKKSHEHIAAQLSIPVNALQLSNLPLKSSQSINNKTDSITTQDRKITADNTCEMVLDAKEAANGKNVNADNNENNEICNTYGSREETEEMAECETPQTARAQMLPAINSDLIKNKYLTTTVVVNSGNVESNDAKNNAITEEQLYAPQIEGCHTVFNEVQKPKLLLEKSVQVNLPSKATGKGKLQKQNSNITNQLSENGTLSHDADTNHIHCKQAKMSENNRQRELMYKSNGKDDSCRIEDNKHHIRDNFDITVGDIQAIDVSPIPREPYIEQSPSILKWNEISPSTRHEHASLPENVLMRVEHQISLLMQQIENARAMKSANEEESWKEIYNYFLSLPDDVVLLMTNRLAKHERIAFLVAQWNDLYNCNSSDNTVVNMGNANFNHNIYENRMSKLNVTSHNSNKNIPAISKDVHEQLPLVSETESSMSEIKKRIITMFLGNRTTERSKHDDSVVLLEEHNSFHSSEHGDVNELHNVNSEKEKENESSLSRSHRSRRFVNVTIASDSDNDLDDMVANNKRTNSNINNNNINNNNNNNNNNIINYDSCIKHKEISVEPSQVNTPEKEKTEEDYITESYRKTLELIDKYRYLELTHSDEIGNKLQITQNAYMYNNGNNNNQSKDFCNSDNNSALENQNGNTVNDSRYLNNTAATVSEDVLHLLNNISSMTSSKEYALLHSSLEGTHFANELAQLATSAQHVLSNITTTSTVQHHNHASPELQNLEYENKCNADNGNIAILSAPPALPNSTISSERNNYNNLHHTYSNDEFTPQQQKSCTLHEDVTNETSLDDISPAQSCPQKVYHNNVNVIRYPHRPTVRSRRSRSTSPLADKSTNTMSQTSPNSKLFSLSRSPYSKDIVNDTYENVTNINKNDILADNDNISDDKSNKSNKTFTTTNTRNILYKINNGREHKTVVNDVNELPTEREHDTPHSLSFQPNVFERLYSNSSLPKGKKAEESQRLS